MKRLTTDKPDGNFETMLNFVYGKDGWAHIRHDGENADAPLTGWAREQCLSHGCGEFPAETLVEIDQEICDCMMDCPDCPVALAYCFASQAVHMRDRLKMYEDILFAEDGAELISIERLRTMTSLPPNPPLTLEELREMTGEAVWLEVVGGDGHYVMFYGFEYNDTGAGFYNEISRPTDQYGKTWVAYRRRRKPEEGEVWQQ